MRINVNFRLFSFSSPTCRKTILLKQGPDELPISVTIVGLLDIQPIEAKCPSCDQMGKLTICEHCQTTKCSNCNEKHFEDIRQKTKNALEKLKSTDENHFKSFFRFEFFDFRDEKNKTFFLLFFLQFRFKKNFEKFERKFRNNFKKFVNNTTRFSWRNKWKFFNN